MEAEDYGKYADLAQDASWEIYWDEDLGYLHREVPLSPEDRGVDYWWFAHAIDTMVDGYARTGDEVYLERAGKIARGVYQRTGDGQSFINDFFDDMAWMGLALLRLYEVTDDDFYLEQAQILFDEITTTWSDVAGGGIGWNRHALNFKNAPSNGPSSILGSRLYRVTGEERYDEWAQRIFDWLHETLRDPRSGFIADGINERRDGTLTHNAYTYNHGTYIGAACERYLITGDERYLTWARETFENARKVYESPSGILKESGEGDGGLFKGILVRYLKLYGEIAGDPEVRPFLEQQAASVIRWAMNDEHRISDMWMGPVKEDPQLSSHLSGVMILEMASSDADADAD